MRAYVKVVATLVVLFGCSSASDSRVDKPAEPSSSRAEVADDPNAYYVLTDTAEERAGPNDQAAVVNRIYRGQKLTVYDSSGRWVRITEPRFDARWVDRTKLSTTRPPTLPQPDIPAESQDERIAADAIPKVGEDGLTADDVRILWRGAKQMLDTKQCSKVEYAAKSTTREGTYYVNCGGENIFFTAAELK